MHSGYVCVCTYVYVCCDKRNVRVMGPYGDFIAMKLFIARCLLTQPFFLKFSVHKSGWLIDGLLSIELLYSSAVLSQSVHLLIFKEKLSRSIF